MRLLIIVLSAFLFVGSQQQDKKSQGTQQGTQTDQRGTASAPLIVEVRPAPKTDEESAQAKKDREEKAANDRNLVKLTAILALVGALQLFVFGYQAYKLRQTVKAAGEQAEAMERHIDEAARSATAMERIANTIKEGNQAVMRAYLTVIIGTPIFQERREGQSDLKFEGKPHLVNTGNTPARKVRIRIKAEILPVPPPAHFTFPLPDEDKQSAGAVVGAHQTYVMSGMVDAFIPDNEVASVKEGTKRVLTIWGLVTYEDIFGDSHTTRFGQWLTWFPNNRPYGFYIPGQNDAD